MRKTHWILTTLISCLALALAVAAPWPPLVIFVAPAAIAACAISVKTAADRNRPQQRFSQLAQMFPVFTVSALAVSWSTADGRLPLPLGLALTVGLSLLVLAAGVSLALHPPAHPDTQQTASK